VFTARYALSPYIEQGRFVLKGLNGITISPEILGRPRALIPAQLLYISIHISCFHSFTLKMEAAVSSKSFVTIYQTTGHLIPECRNIHSHNEIFTSRKNFLLPCRLLRIIIAFNIIRTELN
jgi:hypothetical protein